VNQEEKTLYVKLAYQYYQNKEYKRALDLYVKLCEADPEDYNVFNMTGDTYLKAGIKNKAADTYADTMAIMERKGQNLKTIKLAKKVMKSFPDEQRVKTKLKTALRVLMREAERHVMNHEYAEARELYENMADFSSDEFPVDIKLKEMEADEKTHIEREKQISERSPASGGAQNELIEKFDKMAQNYLNNGDYDGAVETYITALKLAPGNADLRDKLHQVYVAIAQKSAGERVWEKIDLNPRDRMEEAKKKAAEERRTQILKEEEDRARLLMEQEEKIQQEYEQMENDIIQKAAQELKVKLDEAQKKEKLKEEEIQRIMKEQEEKKRELLEKIKKEAIEKWRKQKEAIQGAAAAEAPARAAETIEFTPKPAPKAASLMDHLKKTYDAPKLGEGKDLPETQRTSARPMPKFGAPPPQAAKPEDKGEEKKDDGIMDDIGEVEKKVLKDDIIVNDDTLDSLFTTAYIYVNQGLYKEAMHIHNKIIERYPNHPEAKHLIGEITKKQGT
jgi:tetratricopeptide (TPR) repeat protein